MPPLHERCSDDTLAEFRAAARERFRDGCVLSDGGRRTAAVYLWGYAAEMTVKAAFFASLGYQLHEPSITMLDLRAALGLAVGVGVRQFTNLHDIAGWGQLLVRTRAVLDQPYPQPLANGVLNHTRHIYRVWRETLRYHKNVAYRYEADQVCTAARWLLDRSPVL